MPGRDIDETEIEKENIRQAGETNRKLIEESRIKWTDSGFQTMVGVPAAGLVVALAIVGGIFVHGKYTKPDPPPPCQETTSIVGRSSTITACYGGARQETTALQNSDVMVRCICGGVSVVGDAGHP